MTHRIKAQFSFIVLLLTVSFSTSAFTIAETGDHDISIATEYYHASNNSIGLTAVSKLDHWKLAKNGNLNFGFSETPYWFKTKITLQQVEAEWFLRILYPPLDSISVYLCQAEIINDIEQQCDFFFAGDSIPFNDRVRSNPNHIIPISPQQGDNFLYIKLSASGSSQLPISMIDRQSLDDYLALSDFFRGAYLSVMLVMILYNLFIFLMTRSVTYVLYSGFAFTFLIFHMTYEGSGFQYLWPDLPQWNEFALPMAFAVNQIFTILFITSFLNIKKTSRYSYIYFRVLLAIAGLMLLLTPVVPYNTFIPIFNLLSLTLSCSAFYLGLKYWREGQSAARLFTIAWAVLTIGMITANLKTLGLFPSNFFTRYGYQIGSFLEVVLLSLALGERIRTLQQKHVLAKQALIHEKQDRMSALKQLIIGISHEMNTPIGNIALSNSFLEELNHELKQRLSNSNDAELSKQDLIEYIDQQSEAIGTITKSKKTLGILTHVFSNITVNRTDHPKAEFDLVHVIQDRILTYQDKINFKVNLPEHCLIKSHPSAFILVLNQALDNVIDHAAFCDQELGKPTVDISLSHSNNKLNLMISDNGSCLANTGLIDDDLYQFFLPFYTRSRGTEKKMGLGMYQMKNIVTDLLQGEVKATLSDSGGLKLTILFNREH